MKLRKYLGTACLSLLLPALALGQGATLTTPGNRPAGAIEYGITVTGDTIWSIAANVAQSKGVTIGQAMMTLFSTNPHAFAESNIHRLQLGQVIWVPTQRTFITLSPEEALAEVLRHNQHHAELTVPAEVALIPLEATPPAPEAALVEPTALVEPAALVEPTALAEPVALVEVMPADSPVPPAAAPVAPPAATPSRSAPVTTTRLPPKQQSLTNTIVYLGIATLAVLLLYLLWRRYRRQSHVATSLSGASLDTTGSEVDLARAYIEMGDKTAAIDLLQSVRSKGSASDVAEANELLKNL